MSPSQFRITIGLALLNSIRVCRRNHSQAIRLRPHYPRQVKPDYWRQNAKQYIQAYRLSATLDP